MTNKTSVVTEERFSQGFTYPDYIEQINVNKDRFDRYHGTAKEELSEDDVTFLKQAVESGATKVLVLGEDWCPDVYRGMPVIARVAEASGMELRVFPRDTNLDIMDEFLKNGEHRSIPVMVFYTSDLKYLFHWIERPELANQDMSAIGEEIERDFAGQDEDTIRRARRDRVNAKFPSWQRETVREWRGLLGQALGL